MLAVTASAPAVDVAAMAKVWLGGTYTYAPRRPAVAVGDTAHQQLLPGSG